MDQIKTTSGGVLKLEPGRSTYRKNVSISPVMLERALEMMRMEGFDDFSDFISQILRERYKDYQEEAPKENQGGGLPGKRFARDEAHSRVSSGRAENHKKGTR